MKQVIYVFIAIVLIGSSCNTANQNSIDIFTKVYNTTNLPKQSFTINASKDTILKGKHGTTLSITKNTFVNKQGKVITGDVHIELQEVLTAKDMVLGNLTTTSNGEMLQTGGMIYVNATSNKEQLEIAHSSSIGVSVPAEKKIEGMHIYSAEINQETNQINWVKPEDIIQENKPEITKKVISNSNSLLKPSITETTTFVKPEQTEAISIIKPEKPAKASKSDNRIIHFKFEDPESFPELKQYENVKFRVSEKSEYSTKDADHVWLRVELEKTNSEGVYIVTFSGYENNKYIEKKYEVTPALDGEDYEKAIALYNKKYEQYKAKQQEIAEEKKQREIEFAKEQARNQELIKKRQKEQEERMINNLGINYYVQDTSISYIFNLKQLGWCNIDRIYRDTRSKPVNLITAIQNQSEFRFVYISMIIKNLNMYLPGYKKENKTFGFSFNDKETTRLPVGESAIILATAYKDGKPYFAIQKLTIKQNQELSLILQETTQEKLKEALNTNI